VARGQGPAREFNPVHDTVLDLEAYFHHVMDVQSAAQADAANALRESPDAPLPADPAAAVLSMLSADEAVAREQIAGLEEALRAYKGPKPPPHRVAELFAFLYDKAKSAMPTYRRQRKPKQPKPPKPDAEQPPSPPPPATGADEPPPAEPDEPPGDTGQGGSTSEDDGTA
jgi:hypothetical protein